MTGQGRYELSPAPGGTRDQDIPELIRSRGGAYAALVHAQSSGGGQPDIMLHGAPA